MKQASNCLTVDRWCGPLKPIERGEPIVVSGGKIGAVIEKNLDSLHEACLGGVMEGRGPAAVIVLSSEALVIDTRPMTQERRHILGVILSSLVPGTREPDPRSRPIHSRSCACEHRRQLRMQDPTARADRRGARSLIEKHSDHRHVLARRGLADRAGAAEQGFTNPRDA